MAKQVESETHREPVTQLAYHQSAETPDVKPGSLRTGAGINVDEPWYQTEDGPVQGLSPASIKAERNEWKARDLKKSDMSKDEEIGEKVPVASVEPADDEGGTD